MAQQQQQQQVQQQPRATMAEVEAQAMQLAKAAREMSDSVDKIVVWSRERLECAVASHEQVAQIENVAAKLIAHRAEAVSALGDDYLKQVDVLREAMKRAESVLGDVRSASKQLTGLEQLLASMEKVGIGGTNDLRVPSTNDLRRPAAVQ